MSDPSWSFPSRRSIKTVNEIIEQQQSICLQDPISPFNPSPIPFASRIPFANFYLIFTVAYFGSNFLLFLFSVLPPMANLNRAEIYISTPDNETEAAEIIARIGTLVSTGGPELDYQTLVYGFSAIQKMVGGNPLAAGRFVSASFIRDDSIKYDNMFPGAPRIVVSDTPGGDLYDVLNVTGYVSGLAFITANLLAISRYSGETTSQRDAAMLRLSNAIIKAFDRTQRTAPLTAFPTIPLDQLVRTTNDIFG
jgi:hypothetical protein